MKSRIIVLAVYAALIALLLGGGFLAGRHLASPGIALAQNDSIAIPPYVPNAPELASFYCATLNNVAAFDNRVHLRCSTSNGSVTYYAYPSDPVHFSTANQILAIGNTAYALGEGVWMYYNSDPNLNPPGCLSTDCRGLWGVSMVP